MNYNNRCREYLNLASSPGLKNRTMVIVGGGEFIRFRVILIEKIVKCPT